MSDNIPFEIQMEIIQRIPDTKSVIRCRSVSKEWKSVIDSKDFVAAHTLRHHQAQPHHLLVRHLDCRYEQVKYVSIVDDDTFPNRKLSVFEPDLVYEFSRHSEIVGSSHGLFCLYERNTSTAVIWNPCIRKTVDIDVPNVVLGKLYDRTVVGLGVCPGNLDPKLVKITYVSDWSVIQDVNVSTQVMVFNLSSGGTWRSPLSGNVPHKSIAFGDSPAVVDGFIYWDAVDRIKVDDGLRNYNLIMSFDLASEEFTKVNLPDPLALNPRADLSVSNLRESLAVLEFNIFAKETFHVWMMIGHGCTRSFNKLYSISVRGTLEALGFRRSGTPILEVQNDNEDSYRYAPRALAIYEPESKTITDIGIHGLDDTFSVHPYMETLLLLGH